MIHLNCTKRRWGSLFRLKRPRSGGRARKRTDVHQILSLSLFLATTAAVLSRWARREKEWKNESISCPKKERKKSHSFQYRHGRRTLFARSDFSFPAVYLLSVGSSWLLFPPSIIVRIKWMERRRPLEITVGENDEQKEETVAVVLAHDNVSLKGGGPFSYF